MLALLESKVLVVLDVVHSLVALVHARRCWGSGCPLSCVLLAVGPFVDVIGITRRPRIARRLCFRDDRIDFRW